MSVTLNTKTIIEINYLNVCNRSSYVVSDGSMYSVAMAWHLNIHYNNKLMCELKINIPYIIL